MRSEIAVSLSLLAMAMTLAPAPASAVRMIDMPLCNGGVKHVPVDKPPDGDKHCPGACHMMAGRRRSFSLGCDGQT